MYLERFGYTRVNMKQLLECYDDQINIRTFLSYLAKNWLDINYYQDFSQKHRKIAIHSRKTIIFQGFQQKHVMFQPFLKNLRFNKHVHID